MAKQNFGGVYANMDFPPYEFREYPKVVHTGPHGKYKIVHDAMEEKSVRDSLQEAQDNAPAIVAPYVSDPEKQILISRARELGVPFNEKWSKAKLQMIVEQAECDVDNLPADETPKRKAPITIEQVEEEVISLEDNEKDALLSQAKDLGIKAPAMHLWGVARLKAAIAETKAKHG